MVARSTISRSNCAAPARASTTGAEARGFRTTRRGSGSRSFSGSQSTRGIVEVPSAERKGWKPSRYALQPHSDFGRSARPATRGERSRPVALLEQGPRKVNLPRSFRLLRAGFNETASGRVVFSERAARLVIEDRDQFTSSLAIDVDHASLSANAPPEERAAAAWFDLQVRRDARGGAELWAVDVEWTAFGRRSARSRRRVAPAFEIDPKTREVVSIINASLVRGTQLVTLSSSLLESLKGTCVMQRRTVLGAAQNLGDEPDIQAQIDDLAAKVEGLEIAVAQLQKSAGDSGQSEVSKLSARLAGHRTEQQRWLDERMGMNQRQTLGVRREGNTVTFGVPVAAKLKR